MAEEKWVGGHSAEFWKLDAAFAAARWEARKKELADEKVRSTK